MKGVGQIWVNTITKLSAKELNEQLKVAYAKEESEMRSQWRSDLRRFGLLWTDDIERFFALWLSTKRHWTDQELDFTPTVEALSMVLSAFEGLTRSTKTEGDRFFECYRLARHEYGEESNPEFTEHDHQFYWDAFYHETPKPHPSWDMFKGMLEGLYNVSDQTSDAYMSLAERGNSEEAESLMNHPLMKEPVRVLYLLGQVKKNPALHWSLFTTYMAAGEEGDYKTFNEAVSTLLSGKEGSNA